MCPEVCTYINLTSTAAEITMSFDGPPIQTPNQERRRIQRPPVTILILIGVVLTGIFIWAIAWF